MEQILDFVTKHAPILSFIAACFQAVFAGFLLKVSKGQKKIMAGQTALTKQIDETSKAVKMLGEYGELAEFREGFWKHITYFYEVYQAKVLYVLNRSYFEPLSLHAFLKQSEGFPGPSYDPDSVDNLYEFLKDRSQKEQISREHPIGTSEDVDPTGFWGYVGMFACFITRAPNSLKNNYISSIFDRYSGRDYNEQRFKGRTEATLTSTDELPGSFNAAADSKYSLDDVHDRHFDELSLIQRKLAYFWDRWSGILDISKHIHADPLELVMLSWLEFALVLTLQDQSGRPGKVNLFKFTAKRWRDFSK